VKEQVVVVIAAGNWSLDNDKYHNWPANYGRKMKPDESKYVEMKHVITVMASDQHDERAPYSSYGKESVFIAAPGYARVDAVGRPNTLRTFGSLRDSYMAFRGTSAAAAYVARLAALVRATHRTWSPEEVKQHIGKTGRPVKALETRCATGCIVDFEAALR
jgi:subtilisin family serine protease